MVPSTNETCCGTEVYTSGRPSEDHVPSCEPFVSEWCFLHALYCALYREGEARLAAGERMTKDIPIALSKLGDQKEDVYRRSLVVARERREGPRGGHGR